MTTVDLLPMTYGERDHSLIDNGRNDWWAPLQKPERVVLDECDQVVPSNAQQDKRVVGQSLGQAKATRH